MEDLNINENESVMGIGVRWTKTSHETHKQEESVIDIPESIRANLRNLHALYLYGLPAKLDGNNKVIRKSITYQKSWPSAWHVFDDEMKNRIKTVGIALEIDSQFMLINCNLEGFGRFLYPETQIDTLFNQWVDIGVYDFLNLSDLQRYKNRRKKLGANVNIISMSQVNIGILRAWTNLENCIIRITSSWERLTKYALPAYFGLIPPKKDSEWKTLFDESIPTKIKGNDNQCYFFDAFNKIRIAYIGKTSELKVLRNALIHELSPRPIGAISTSANQPHTLDGLHKLVVVEHDKFREALLLFAGIIRSKTSENQFVD